MVGKTPISKIMTRDLLVVDINDTIGEAAETFRNYSLRHAPVISHGSLVGMISLVDMKNMENANSLEVIDTSSGLMPLSVKHLMTADPVTIQEHTSVEEVATIFIENEFHAVPVMNGDQIVGIVSTTDIIAFFLETLDKKE